MWIDQTGFQHSGRLHLINFDFTARNRFVSSNLSAFDHD